MTFNLQASGSNVVCSNRMDGLGVLGKRVIPAQIQDIRRNQSTCRIISFSPHIDPDIHIIIVSVLPFYRVGSRFREVKQFVQSQMSGRLVGGGVKPGLHLFVSPCRGEMVFRRESEEFG